LTGLLQFLISSKNANQEAFCEAAWAFPPDGFPGFYHGGFGATGVPDGVFFFVYQNYQLSWIVLYGLLFNSYLKIFNEN
jgi:hypothetical protein